MSEQTSPIEQHEVIIIGGGPAGLAAAAELKRLGILDVVVLEREQHAGGVPRHCGHIGFGWREFRRILTGPAYARRLVAAAKEIDVRTGTTALELGAGGHVKALTPTGIQTLIGRCVLLALGTRETPRAARLISGTRPWGVFTTGALQQLIYLSGLKPCTRAVIVGSELVSFSSLLTLRHAGIKSVAMLEESACILAPRPAQWIARVEFGTRVLTRTRLVSIFGEKTVSGIEVERDGQRERIDCDGVIFSGRFVPEAALLKTSALLVDPATGGPVVDQYGRCSEATYFAAGNILRPVEASWTVWQEGCDVARAIAASLSGRLPRAEYFTSLEPREPLRYICPQKMAFPAPLPPALPINTRVARAIQGRVRLRVGQHTEYGPERLWQPDRRILLPWPADVAKHVERLHIDIDEIVNRG
jgi:NADPH-dependent 2,4-dienoyl-CoA reductase/sulfur reductase-like enzyme